MTTSSSSSVVPGSFGLLRPDVTRSPFATFLPIGSQGDNVVITLLAGAAIAIGVSPRINEAVALFQIGPLPAGSIARRFHQHLQPFFLGRKPADIQLEGIDCRTERIDLDAGALDLGPGQIL
jgi:hypothetical protein